MEHAAIRRIDALVEFLESRKDALTIDADTHVTDLTALTGTRAERYRSTPGYYHGRPISAEDLLTEMAMAGVDMALVWQNPAATDYTDDPEHNYRALLAANRYVADSARRYPEKLVPGGWIDPKALGLDRALSLTEQLVRHFGFLFVKMNPAQNRFPIDSESVQAITTRIVELGAIPAFHFGADTPFTPADGLDRIAELHPDHPVLAIHMGGGGAGYLEADELYREASALGLRRPNIRYVLSAKRDTHIESALIAYTRAGEPFCRNLCCASDAPYGRMTWNFGGYRTMLRSLEDGAKHTDPYVREHPGMFTEDIVRGYLGRNFAELVISGYDLLLRVQNAA